MKKSIIILLLSTTLISCSWFTPPLYDNNQYFFFVEMETDARYLVDECGDDTLVENRIDQMLRRSEVLQTYSYFLPSNNEIHKTSNIINKQILDFRKRYEQDKSPSITYCKLKSKTLIKELRRILKAMGHLQEI